MIQERRRGDKMSSPCVVAFILALKAKAVAQNWERVCRLFEATLQSVYKQTDGDFRVIVVCHDRPVLRHMYDGRVEFITADFPPPARVYDLMMTDKWKKLALGVKRAGEFAPGFVMLMDADDLVSNRLVDHAKRYPDSNGWKITRGYYYAFGSQWIERTNTFDCGTNALVSARLIRFPRDLTEESIGNCVILRWGHTRTAEKLAEAGTPLEPLPFRGAIWISNHADNATDLSEFGGSAPKGLRWMFHQIRTKQLVSSSVVREFSMQELNSGAQRSPNSWRLRFLSGL